MSKQTFVRRSLKAESMELVDEVNKILDEMEARGYVLTLRQLYYQLVSRDLLPERWRDPRTGSKNNYRAYKNLGSLTSDARQAGLIDWERLEDRNRQTVTNSHWTDPADILGAAARSFAIDKWLDQPYYLLVMCEKDALSGVLEPVCSRLDVTFAANKGYSSTSTMYQLGRILRYQRQRRKSLLVLYFGDHDPSGLDMGEDVERRLSLYSGVNDIQVKRLALNYEQVEQLQPPENPVKETDSRSDWYIEQYGESCWELDAVDPGELERLLVEAVDEVRDEEIWEAALERESEWKEELEELADKWGKE